MTLPRSLAPVLLGAAVATGCGESGAHDDPVTAGGAAGASAGAAGSAGLDAPGGTGGTGALGGAGGIGAAGGDGTTGGAAPAGAAGATAGAAGGAGDASSGVDADGDGLDDALESSIADGYFPFYSIAPDDACPLHGVVYRVAPHPADATKITIWYDVLFERDCGLNGHAGDDEVFGVIADPDLPPPGGILAVRAISHQGTFCEGNTTCGTLAGCDPCATAERNGASYPIVFASVSKHGGYVKESTCDANVICDFGGCTLAAQPSAPPLVNAGEPGKPLVTNLTTQGFVNAAAGWTETSLFDFDPWSGADFGGAGNVADDLQDPAFVIDPGGC